MAISATLANRLETYYRLLAAWNQKINLSGIDLSEPTPEALDRLLVEPLVAAKHVRPGTELMMDIGSGGGSPAIPFALAVPGSRLLMVESKTRKSVFLKEAVRALEMNGEVLTFRFEALLSRPDLHETHDLLTIRAVRVESRILMSLQAFVKPGGHMFLVEHEQIANTRVFHVKLLDEVPARYYIRRATVARRPTYLAI